MVPLLRFDDRAKVCLSAVLSRFNGPVHGVILGCLLLPPCLPQVSRSRSRFFRGDRDLILYTGRAHFFNRFSIRGIHHLIFYSLPLYPQFYPEMVNLLEVRAGRNLFSDHHPGRGFRECGGVLCATGW